MYRLLVETLLGLKLEGDRLRLIPRFPKNWTTYKIHYRYRQRVYHITINRLPDGSAGATELSLDGKALAEETIPLVDDHAEHFVEILVRETPSKNPSSAGGDLSPSPVVRRAK